MLNTQVSLPTRRGGLKVGEQKGGKIYDIQSFRKTHIQSQPRQLSGDTANFSGIYRIEHAQHPVAKELVVLKGAKFPSCAACNEPITFILVVQADEITDDPDFA